MFKRYEPILLLLMCAMMLAACTREALAYDTPESLQEQTYRQQQQYNQEAQLRAQQERNRIMQQQLDDQRSERSHRIRENMYHQWGY